MRVELSRRGDDEGERDERVSKSTASEAVAERAGLRELVDVSVHARERAGDRIQGLLGLVARARGVRARDAESRRAGGAQVSRRDGVLGDVPGGHDEVHGRKHVFEPELGAVLARRAPLARVRVRSRQSRQVLLCVDDGGFRRHRLGTWL